MLILYSRTACQVSLATTLKSGQGWVQSPRARLSRSARLTSKLTRNRSDATRLQAVLHNAQLHTEPHVSTNTNRRTKVGVLQECNRAQGHMGSGQPVHLLVYGAFCLSRVLFRTAQIAPSVDQHRKTDRQTSDTIRHNNMFRLMRCSSLLLLISQNPILNKLMFRSLGPPTRNR